MSRKIKSNTIQFLALGLVAIAWILAFHKMSGIIDLDWLWVLSPIWMPSVLIVSGVITALSIMCFYEIVKYVFNPKDW